MTCSTDYMPQGRHSLSPCLITRDGKSAIEFYQKAFGAEVLTAIFGPDKNHLANAVLKIGDSVFIVADEWPQDRESRSPVSLNGTSVSMYLFVEDVDRVFKNAVDAGAKPVQEPAEMFWGDRWCLLVDPEGHYWQIATHLRDLSDDEMHQAAQAFLAKIPH